ncbi:MAG: hypothetical protein Q8N23_03405 [Archangium sp.]|nr:hypothetical protein [Archangium sp.]MDP3573209.1 hypothetical protein [Archangium sp.]
MPYRSHFAVLAALILSCAPSTTRVSERACTGCRTAEGICLVGNETDACGLQGVSCAQCVNPQVCAQGACIDMSGAGGGGGFTITADGGVDDCSAEAKLIYVVDQDRTLSSFNPRLIGQPNGPFIDLGQISCASEPGAEPFSMAVDRNATAWIVYDSGELFTVDVKAIPLTCVKTGFMPQQNVAKFGMGFVANEPGSKEETLFISGSDLASSLSTTKFGTLMTAPPYRVSVTGTLNGAPELTGTGDAKLWAFLPNVTPPKVARLSKVNGAIESVFEAQALAGVPRAWAFAFWGGDFFVFLERSTDSSTKVWRVNGSTGAVTAAVGDTSRTIVGAGVSTCAPVEIN